MIFVGPIIIPTPYFPPARRNYGYSGGVSKESLKVKKPFYIESWALGCGAALFILFAVVMLVMVAITR